MNPADRTDRRQRFAAGVRRAPGYQALHDGVLPRLRGSATLTDLVWRVFTPPHELGTARRAFRADLLPEGADLLPVVAFVAVGLDPDTLDSALDEVASLQSRASSFRAVVLVDRPVFAQVRSRGFVVDHVIPESDWYGDPEDHAPYLARRIVSVVQGFRPWHLVRLDEHGRVPPDDAALLVAVGRVLHPGPGDSATDGAAAP